MKLFEKKSQVPTDTKTEILRLDLDDFPSKALELTYMEMMERYTDSPSARLQKIMVQISKELNSRAKRNNGEAQVEVSISHKEKPKTNLEQLSEKRVDQMVEKSEKKQNILNRPITEVFKRKKKEPKQIQKTEESFGRKQEKIVEKSIQDYEKKKKPKKSIGSFFKKKIPVYAPSEVTVEDANQVIKQVEPIEKTKKKFSMPLTKKKGYNLKGIELICECGHYLKSHQKGGVSIGCQRCGCLKTIEEIATKQGIKLKLKDQSQVVDPVIEKQAQQVQTMTPKKKTYITKPPAPPTEKVDEIDHSCTCDHTESEHYEGKFCYNCNCSKFTPYPQDKPKEKTE